MSNRLDCIFLLGEPFLSQFDKFFIAFANKDGMVPNFVCECVFLMTKLYLHVENKQDQGHQIFAKYFTTTKVAS